jgi:hypothetical protein
MASRHGAVEGGPIDWPARAAQAEQTVAALRGQLDQLAQAHQAVAPLEHRYDQFPQLLLQVVPEVESIAMLSGMLGFVEQLLTDYSGHPSLAQGEAGPQVRLQVLQQVHATIGRRLQDLRRPKPAVAAGTPEGAAPDSLPT